jgi:hypothetical protein
VIDLFLSRDKREAVTCKQQEGKQREDGELARVVQQPRATETKKRGSFLTFMRASYIWLYGRVVLVECDMNAILHCKGSKKLA